MPHVRHGRYAPLPTRSPSYGPSWKPWGPSETCCSPHGARCPSGSKSCVSWSNGCVTSSPAAVRRCVRCPPWPCRRSQPSPRSHPSRNCRRFPGRQRGPASPRWSSRSIAWAPPSPRWRNASELHSHGATTYAGCCTRTATRQAITGWPNAPTSTRRSRRPSACCGRHRATSTLRPRWSTPIRHS